MWHRCPSVRISISVCRRIRCVDVAGVACQAQGKGDRLVHTRVTHVCVCRKIDLLARQKRLSKLLDRFEVRPVPLLLGSHLHA